MPSKTAKQRRTMALACKNPKRAKAVGLDIPQSVACEFHAADRRAARRKKRKRKRA